jgi:uncharacterized protein YoxC
MTQETLWLILAIAAIVIAVSFAVMAWALWQVAMDARRTSRSTEALVATLSEEVPPTLKAVERATRSLDTLAGEGSAQVAAVERVATEAQATLVAVRELSATVNEIMRGPADTVIGVRKSARAVGTGLATGADRIRRAILREDEEEPTDSRHG